MMACLGPRMADPLRFRKNTRARGAFEGQNRAPRNGAGAALDDGKLVAGVGFEPTIFATLIARPRMLT
jgi:hypothetical protein